MGRLIDAEKLKNHCFITITPKDRECALYQQGWNDAIDAIVDNEPEEVIRCKDCTHFHYDFWADVNGVPLIVGHEICDFWSDGCKTREDAFCSYAERRTDAADMREE